jgi:hypothetical protein
MEHPSSPPIIVNKTFELNTVDAVSLDLCRSIVDYIFPSFYIIEKCGYSMQEQI